jgi:hypothetical protein
LREEKAMAKRVYDICHGERYKDKEGKDRTKWNRIGVVFETANGLAIKLNSVPVGFDGWLKMFEAKEKVAA